MAFGVETKASGDQSLAMGAKSSASGMNSLAIGYGNEAAGTQSVAVGNSTNASGNFSVAMGLGAQAGTKNDDVESTDMVRLWPLVMVQKLRKLVQPLMATRLWQVEWNLPPLVPAPMPQRKVV